MFNPYKIIDFSLAYHYRLAYIERIAKDNSWELYGDGRHRRVFLSKSGRCIIKFPMNSDGLKANQSEADNFKLYRGEADENGVVYAPCRLMKDSVLLMVKMKYKFGFEHGLVLAQSMGIDIPDWAHKIDCHQVGMMPSGKMVAYDSYEGR